MNRLKEIAREMIDWAINKYGEHGEKNRGQEELDADYMMFETHEATEGFLERFIDELSEADSIAVMAIAEKLRGYGDKWETVLKRDYPDYAYPKGLRTLQEYAQEHLPGLTIKEEELADLEISSNVGQKCRHLISVAKPFVKYMEKEPAVDLTGIYDAINYLMEVWYFG